VVAALRYGGEALVISRPVTPPGAIVALASHEWERLPEAAALARQYPDARVLLTLPVHVTSSDCFDCSRRVAWLDQVGIDPSRVTVLSRRVTNTNDEAHATAWWAHRHQVGRLIVVTSPYHARRALAAFRHAFEAEGLHTAIGVDTPCTGVDPAHWWLRSYDRRYVAYEWAGLLYYAVRYGVSPFV
jgi:uncharacterized SAM-binding protein YcdF (DUF218 family)